MDEEHLWECLKLADLDEKINKLPDKLDTVFGMGIIDGAVEFSGGELQKLMLARALYKQAPLMVLDEPRFSRRVKEKNPVSWKTPVI